MTKPQEKPVEKKRIFSSIGGFFKKEEAVKPNITSQIAEPVTNISKEYRNVPIVSNESNINRNYDHSTNNQNIVQNQPSLLNNILNIGPGTDRNKGKFFITKILKSNIIMKKSMLVKQSIH